MNLFYTQNPYTSLFSLKDKKCQKIKKHNFWRWSPKSTVSIPNKKKTPKPTFWCRFWCNSYNLLIFSVVCGERGIRTPGSSHFNGFQDRRDRPLCHLSNADANIRQKSELQKYFHRKYNKYFCYFMNLSFCYNLGLARAFNLKNKICR